MKKKTVSKVISVVLAAFMASSLFACGKKEKGEHEFELHYYRSGMGIDWLNNMKAGFEKKYDGYKIRIEDAAEDVGKNLDAGGDIVTGDLFIGGMSWFMDVKDYLEPLDEILDLKADGGDMTIREKIYENTSKTMIVDGKTYALSWANVPCGLFYNKTIFDSMGYKTPRTSDEMVSFARTVISDANSAKGITIDGKPIKDSTGATIKPTPFIHAFANAPYWEYIWKPWMAQYDGIESYVDSTNATWKDPETGEKHYPSINAGFTQGHYEALDALDKVISPKGHTYSRSNSITHTDSQTFFLNGYALMTPCGGWLENEMKNTKMQYDIDLMKTPVLSAVGTKLGISEDLLREAVSYVDSADYSSKTVNDDSAEYDAAAIKAIKAYTEDNHRDVKGNGISGDAILNEIYEDRNIVFNNGAGQRMLMPNYSTRKEEVKLFLQYMFSDEGLQIFMNSTRMPAPAKFENEQAMDTSKMSTFGKSLLDSAEKANFITQSYNCKFYRSNSFFWTFYIENAQRSFTPVNDSEKLSAADLWKKEYANYTGRWADACSLKNIDVNDTQSTNSVKFYGRKNPLDEQ